MEGTILSDRVLENYDYIVIGSGFTALAFINETLRLRPQCRILCIERGDDGYASHYKELLQHAESKIGHSMAIPDVIPGQCPWHITAATSSSEELNSCAGACFLLGGRSNYWYGWCMRPTPEQMRGFPALMIQATRDPQFWEMASKLLGVMNVKQLGPIYFDCLQCIIERRLDDLALQVPTFQGTRPACFASPVETGSGFLRCSVAEQLQRMATPSADYGIPALDILLNHTVTRLQHTIEDGSVDSISTHQGRLRLPEPETKVVLCAGVSQNSLGCTLAALRVTDNCRRYQTRYSFSTHSHISLILSGSISAAISERMCSLKSLRQPSVCKTAVSPSARNGA